MALPTLHRKLFRNDGYGPLLRPEIIPFASDLASSDDSVAASTKWVKDLAQTAFYVDPDGSDDNDGLTSATAFQTFAKAIDAGTKSSSCRIIIHAAPGTYSGEILCDSDRFVHIHSTGDVTVNGSVSVVRNSSLLVACTNLTVNGCVGISKSSYAYFNCTAAYITPPSGIGLDLDIGSSCEFTGTLTLTVLNGDFAIALFKSSQLTVNDQITATVNVNKSAIVVSECSSFVCFAKVTVNSQDSGNDHDNVRATSALFVNNCSFAYAYALATTNIFSESCCWADNGSSLTLVDGGYLHGPKRSTTISGCLAATHGSTVYIGHAGGTRTDCITHHSSGHAVFCGYGSNLTIYSSFLADTYNYGTGAGSASSVFMCFDNSFLALSTSETIYTINSINVSWVFRAFCCSTIFISSSLTFSGNASANANCKKFYIATCSNIRATGRNAANLPGPQAGVTSSNGVYAS